ncbi:hypothetical protein ACSBR2_030999 [Camellia fascicularis]
MANLKDKNGKVSDDVDVKSRKFKLNPDGYAKSPSDRAGYKELFRDEKGMWIFGYSGKIKKATSLEVEV